MTEILRRDLLVGREGVVSVRLSEEEIGKLDIHTRGRLSRSQIIRALIEDFLEKSEKQQRDFLVHHFFGEQ